MKLEVLDLSNIPWTIWTDATPFYKSRINFVKKVSLSRLDLCFGLLENARGPILDLGCGSGILLPSLSKMGDVVIGVDVHDRLSCVNNYLIKNKIKNVHLIRADAHHLPFKDRSFGSIVSISVLDHLRDPAKSVKEIRRIILEKGTVIFGYHINSIIYKLIAFLAVSFYVLLLIFASPKRRGKITTFFKNIISGGFLHTHTDIALVEMISKELEITKKRCLWTLAPVFMAVKCKRH